MLGSLVHQVSRRVAITTIKSTAARSLSTSASSTTFKLNGQVGDEDFSISYFNEKGEPISPWHDLSLRQEDDTSLFTMVNEIPRYTTAKMEIDTKDTHNPIVQDRKKGLLRHYHGPLYWNYGCLSQTWEDPNHYGDENVGRAGGDNDPLDVVEIGSTTIGMGDIVGVKPLGALSMIDDGELDWKLICIRGDDPMATSLNDVRDVERLLPGTISGIREWFRWYKTPDGKPINAFGHGEAALSLEETMKVIEETHSQWKALRDGIADQGQLWK
jgi:inorganic pyrophosphatase